MSGLQHVAVVVGVGPGEFLLPHQSWTQLIVDADQDSRSEPRSSADMHGHPIPGTGAAVARRFAREGFKTALLSRKLENLIPIEHEIQQAGGKAISVPCDCGAFMWSPPCFAAVFTQIACSLQGGFVVDFRDMA